MKFNIKITILLAGLSLGLVISAKAQVISLDSVLKK
jgi:hypothetical protein